jgi:hypothetical protein
VGDLATTIDALSIAVSARVPVLLWGPPGTGKTSVVRSLAASLNWPCETVIASIREPSDFAGLPIINDGRAPGGDGSAGAPGAQATTSTYAHVDLAPPRWARRLAAAGSGLLFLDEISTAPPAVQAALLRVVLERTVGDLPLPDGVAVVAAGNPPEQAADGWDLSPPLANRFCHLDWAVDTRAVAAGFVSGFPPVQVRPLDPSWETVGCAAASGFVAGFLVARPGLTCAVPVEVSSSGRGWPSPRSWEMAARLTAAWRASGAGREARAALVTGCVGEGAGLEFLAWLDELDLPDPEIVLADPQSFVVPARPDRALAALHAVTAVVIASPSPERWQAGWAVLVKAAEVVPDVAAVSARTLAKHRPDGAPVPAEVSVFAPLLREAGLV